MPMRVDVCGFDAKPAIEGFARLYTRGEAGVNCTYKKRLSLDYRKLLNSVFRLPARG